MTRSRPSRETTPACRPERSRPRPQCGASGLPLKFDSISAIVDDYVRNQRPEAESQLEWFGRRSRTFAEAIETAALGRMRHGKQHPHPHRVSNAALRRACEELRRRGENVRECSTFAELLEIVQHEMMAINGVGELAAYDTAYRIGAYLDHQPERVYLHAGTKVGARAFRISGGRSSIHTSELPREFGRLRPYEIEDCLCIYADDLHRITGV